MSSFILYKSVVDDIYEIIQLDLKLTQENFISFCKDIQFDLEHENKCAFFNKIKNGHYYIYKKVPGYITNSKILIYELILIPVNKKYSQLNETSTSAPEQPEQHKEVSEKSTQITCTQTQLIKQFNLIEEINEQLLKFDDFLDNLFS